MSPGLYLVISAIFAGIYLMYEHERRRAERLEEERDIFIDLLVAEAHERIEDER